MSIKRTQNKIAEGRFTLPISGILAALVCLAGGVVVHNLWMQFICLILSTYLMVEVTNANALLRVYSRMISCSFLLLTVMAFISVTDIKASIVQLCLISFYLTVFRCYQTRGATGWVFYGFFCMGLASIVFTQILFFVPFIWIMMAVNLLAFSHRTFWASVLGLAAPYWFLCTYYFATGDIDSIVNHFNEIVQFQPLFRYGGITEHQVVTFAFIFMLALTGIIHYLRTSFRDKIRTRMIYEIFITMDILSIVFVTLQPQHYNVLITMMIVNTSPLIAHFIVHTHTWITNIYFHFILLLTAAITIYDLWLPSLIF